jgi:hypothetical protein
VSPRFIVPPDDSFKIINVGQFIIKSPDTSTNKGDEVQHLDVHFYFGTTEIKVVATVNGHSSAFNLKYIGST